MKRLWIMLIPLLFILGCGGTNTNTLESKIIETIDANCKDTGSCTFNMKDITTFEWDNVAIYGYLSSSKDISKNLGIKYTPPESFSSGLVFTYNNKVVHEEYSQVDFEGPVKIQYVVDKFGSPDSRVFNPDNAIFKGEKKKSNDKFYYVIETLETKD